MADDKPELTITNNWPDILRSLEKLTNMELYVGVPASTSPRWDTPITNATLAYIHNYGSDAANIPPRPFLEPGILAVKDQLIKIYVSAGNAALQGDMRKTRGYLAMAGGIAAESVKDTIKAGIPPPLAASTIARRKNKYASGGITPLIDTGQLVNSITFVIRDKEE